MLGLIYLALITALVITWTISRRNKAAQLAEVGLVANEFAGGFKDLFALLEQKLAMRKAEVMAQEGTRRGSNYPPGAGMPGSEHADFYLRSLEQILDSIERDLRLIREGIARLRRDPEEGCNQLGGDMARLSQETALAELLAKQVIEMFPS